MWVLRRWYLFWQCFQHSLSTKAVLKKKVSFSQKGQKSDPNDLADCVHNAAINTQHQEFLFRCLLQIIVPKVRVSKFETLHVVWIVLLQFNTDFPGVEKKNMDLTVAA